MFHAIISSIALAALMTFGDFAWAALHLRHRMAYGIVHGAVMCLGIGLAVGIRAQRKTIAALAGLVIGMAAAGAFYLLAPAMRWWAMFPSWMLLWVLFALLQRQLVKGERMGTTFKRGMLAALLSGLAFYLVSDIWIHESAHRSLYVHFAAWTFAFLPGCSALFARVPSA